MQFIALAPLIFVNIWHGLVILTAWRKGKAWRSISESALASCRLLWTHRIVHTLGAVCLFGLAVCMWPVARFQFPAILLIFAVVLDITQAFALSKNTRHAPMNLCDIHQLTAWMMAGAYLLFSILFMQATGATNSAVVAYVVWLFSVYAWSSLTKHRHFWLTQMVFFLSVGAAIATCVGNMKL